MRYYKKVDAIKYNLKRYKNMDYSTKSYNDRLADEKRYNRQGCLRFILYFLLMALCIWFIALTQS